MTSEKDIEQDPGAGEAVPEGTSEGASKAPEPGSGSDAGDATSELTEAKTDADAPDTGAETAEAAAPDEPEAALPDTEDETPQSADREGQDAPADDEASDEGDDESDSEGDEAGPEEEVERTRVTALYGLHQELGARFTAFAGYEMPLQFKAGILTEHKHTRAAASLFDVSHMGQAFIRLRDGGDHEEVAQALERLVPGDLVGLAPGRVRYTLLLNEQGGIVDDLLVTRPQGEENEGLLFLVVNASRKEVDFDMIDESLEDGIDLIPALDRSLLALQGPKAEAVLASLVPEVEAMRFLSATTARIGTMDCIISRTGYTGEDGFEISVRHPDAEPLARLLLGFDDVMPAGLGARDSLRLEAGLCLYGEDMDESTSPIEADLAWTIGRRRKESADFPGSKRILKELAEGPARVRVGLMSQGRVPARAGAKIQSSEGAEIGVVTSGCFGPTAERPVAMGFVQPSFAAPGTELNVEVRGRLHPVTVTELPFVPHQYKRTVSKASTDAA